MNSGFNIDDLTIITKFHVLEKKNLYDYFGDAIRMGVDVFGGTVENHDHDLWTPYNRDLRIINRFSHNNGCDVVAEIRPFEVMEGYQTRGFEGIPYIQEEKPLFGDTADYMSTLFNARNMVNYFHLLPEIPEGYSLDGNRKIDDLIISEFDHIKNGSKTVILEYDPDFNNGEYSDIAERLIEEEHDLRISLNLMHDLNQIPSISEKHERPIYLNVGNISFLDQYGMERIMCGLQSGASGLILDVPINGQGIEPLRRTLQYVAKPSGKFYQNSDITQ